MSKSSTLGEGKAKDRTGQQEVAIIALDHVFTARLIVIRKQHTEKPTRYTIKLKKCPVNSRAAIYRPLADDQTIQNVLVKLPFPVRWDPLRSRAPASRAPYWFPFEDSAQIWYRV